MDLCFIYIGQKKEVTMDLILRVGVMKFELGYSNKNPFHYSDPSTTEKISMLQMINEDERSHFYRRQADLLLAIQAEEKFGRDNRSVYYPLLTSSRLVLFS
jgi:hypothetical protein